MPRRKSDERGMKVMKRDKPVHSSKLRSAGKKGGRGAFGWGAPGDEMDVPEMDKDDPCYESEGEDSYILISRGEQELKKAQKCGINTGAGGGRPRLASGSYQVGSPPRFNYDPSKARSKPPVTLSLFKTKVIQIIEEYFASGDIDNVAELILEIQCPVFHYEFVKRAITMAMDRGNSTREAVSKLISGLYPKALSTNQIGKGFERLFEQSESLELDIPGAHEIISKFLSRAVLDEVLPPSFLNDPVVNSMGGEIVDKAKVMLSCSHGLSRLEHVWGPGDGRRVSELKAVIKQTINEFLLSGDLEEAAKCVRELDIDYYHHEVVKRAVVISMDRDVAQQQTVSDLFAYLFVQQIISKGQFEVGFTRLAKVLPDMRLDVPAAGDILNGFISKGIAAKYLPADFTVKKAAMATESAALPPQPPTEKAKPSATE